MQTVGLPATDSDPGPARHTHRIACRTAGFQEMKPLALRRRSAFRGSIPSLALWLINRHLFGFTQFVTSLYAKFCSDLVVSLWPGWIVQLICISLPWRTHRCVSRNAGEGQTAKPLGDLDTTDSLINTPCLIRVGLAAVVRTVTGQVVSDPHQHAPQATIGLADDRPTIIVRLIALMT